MATVPTNSKKFTIASGDAFYLGNPGGTEVTGTTTVHMISNTFSGTITVKARIYPNTDWQTDTITPVAWSYVTYYLNGTTASGGLINTGITGTSIILVPSTGLQIVLDCTTYTSGSMTVYVGQVNGAAV